MVTYDSPSFLLEDLIKCYRRRSSNYFEALTDKCSELYLEADFLDSLFPVSDLKYHNKEHMVNVAFDVDFIASRERISVEGRRNLFLAGLFHDVDHTGVASPDSVNISLVENFFIRNRIDFISVLEVDPLIDVMPLVRATNTDLYEVDPSLLGGFLRDADLLAWAYSDFHILSSKLADEFEFEVTVDGTSNFLKSHKFYSSTAIEVMKAAGWL